jgi:cobalt-precorrin-7 (C5)-methyltransferase
MSKLKLVGTGPGSPEYITPIAKKLVKNAELVIGAERSLDLFQDYIKSEILRLTASNVKRAIKQGVKVAQDGKNVVILSTGDPGFSGLLRTLVSVAGKDADVDIIPGVSSIQVCAARLRMRWDTADLVSFHADITNEKKVGMVDSLKKGKPVILLPDPHKFTPCDVAKFLIGHGIPKETPVGICEKLTIKNENTTTSTLSGILEQKFDRLCVMIVGMN